MPPCSKAVEVESNNQQAPPSAGKNSGVVLLPCYVWKCVRTSFSGSVDIHQVLGCHLLQQISSQWGSQKLLQGSVSHELITYLIIASFLTQ